MLELDLIASVEWNQELGIRLKAMRGEVSCRRLAAKVQDLYEYKVSQQYIQLLEHPEGNEKAPSSVSFKLLRYLTQALGRDVYELFDSREIVTKEKLREKPYEVHQGKGGLFVPTGDEPMNSPNVQLRMPMSLYLKLKEVSGGKFGPWIREAIKEKLERNGQGMEPHFQQSDRT